MKKKLMIFVFAFFIFFYFNLIYIFATCELTSNLKNISINNDYNISGIFKCEKIDLNDYNECSNADIFWWNGTIWMKNASIGCPCVHNSECNTGLCFREICSYNVSDSIPFVNFENKTPGGPKDSLIWNIIIINNSFNRDDIFDVKIEHDGSANSKLIWMFSYIAGKQFDEDDKFGQYEIEANSSRKILLITQPIDENIVANLTVIAKSHLTGLSATDSAKYTITPFESEFFFAKSTPDIGFFAVFLTGFLAVCLFKKKYD